MGLTGLTWPQPDTARLALRPCVFARTVNSFSFLQANVEPGFSANTACVSLRHRAFSGGIKKAAMSLAVLWQNNGCHLSEAARAWTLEFGVAGKIQVAQ